MGENSIVRKVDFDFYKCGTFGPQHFEIGERVRIYSNNVDSAEVWGVEGVVSKLDYGNRDCDGMVHLKVLRRGKLDGSGCLELKPIKVYGGRVPYINIGHVEKI
jgi:hypothetical protein